MKKIYKKLQSTPDSLNRASDYSAGGTACFSAAMRSPGTRRFNRIECGYTIFIAA